MKRLKWLRLALLNFILIGILLELLIRLVAPALPGQLGITARWVTTGQPFTEDWTPAWQQNRDLYYALRPNIQNELQYGSPSVSFRLSTIELWEGGGIGFRTRPIDFFVDAVVVGDSFGLCFTEDIDCWVNQLATQTNKGLVNLSQPVTGTTSHLRILQDFGAPLTPPVIIWQFFGNDFNDDYGLAVFRKEIEDISPDEVVPVPHSPLDWLRRNSAAFAVLETALTGNWYGAPDTERLFVKPYRAQYGENTLMFGGLYEQQALDMSLAQNQIGLNYSRRAFSEAKDLIGTWNGKMVVVIIPTREEVYAHLTEDILGEETLKKLSGAREAMFVLCEELDLTCYDPLPMFKARALQNEALYYADDMHLNPHGNAALALALAEWLKDSGTME